MKIQMSQKQIIGGDVVFGGRKLPLSWAVRAGDFVFVSGTVSVDENGVPQLGCGIEEQTRNALLYIEKVLKDAGCTMADAVKASVFLKNPEDMAAYDAVYAEFFPDGPPARFTVVTDFVAPGVLIEIEVTAYKPLN